MAPLLACLHCNAHLFSSICLVHWTHYRLDIPSNRNCPYSCHQAPDLLCGAASCACHLLCSARAFLSASSACPFSAVHVTSSCLYCHCLHSGWLYVKLCVVCSPCQSLCMDAHMMCTMWLSLCCYVLLPLSHLREHPDALWTSARLPQASDDAQPSQPGCNVFVSLQVLAQTLCISCCGRCLNGMSWSPSIWQGMTHQCGMQQHCYWPLVPCFISTGQWINYYCFCS